jgi:hypothetical protein
MSYRPIRRARGAKTVADGRRAGPAVALVPALAVLLLAAGPALARPHGSPDLTPTIFLPRHPDFELLSQVDCLSGPCLSGAAFIAQAPEAEPEEEEPEPPPPAPLEASDAGPATAQDAPQQRSVPAEAQESQNPALAAGTAGAARPLLSGTTAADLPQAAGGAAETAIAEGDARPAGTVEANETLVPTLPAGDVADNTGPESEERTGDLVVASLPETVDLGSAGEVEDNTAAAEVEGSQSGLMSLRGRQAALDEALGVGGFGQSDMTGLRRLSLTSPGTVRTDAGTTRPVPPRTALRDLVTRAGPARAPDGPMDSDERQAVHRHAVDRPRELTAPGETEAPVAPIETAAPTRPVVAPTEPTTAEPRAPASAPGGGAGAGAGGASAPAPPIEVPG